MKHFISIFLFLLSVLPLAGQNVKNTNADSIIGEYFIPDEKNGDSKVRFFKNAEGTFDCQVFWIDNNIDPKTGKPWLDVHNPDKSLRGRRCDQIVIIKGLKFNAAKGQWDGAKIYDPNRGIRVSVTCKFRNDGDLEVRGSVLGIGETMSWKKLK